MLRVNPKCMRLNCASFLVMFTWFKRLKKKSSCLSVELRKHSILPVNPEVTIVPCASVTHLIHIALIHST